MFAAARFIAAAMIVALFGAFLLAGILNSPDGNGTAPAAVISSPPPGWTDVLPTGALTEGVQPGVLRILEDGAGHSHREWEGDELRGLSDVHVGSDGSVWILTDAWHQEVDEGWPVWQAWQVGLPGRHETTDDDFPGGSWWGAPVLASTPDGTLWAGGNHLASFDGEDWIRHDPRGPSGNLNYDYKYPRAVTVLPDGTLWAVWWFDIGRLGPDGWTIYGAYDPPTDDEDPNAPCNHADVTRRIVVLADGSLVAGGPGCLVRFDGDTWQELESPDIATTPMSDEIRAAGDGTLWAHINTAEYMQPSNDYLARFEGEGWSMFPVTNGTTRMRTVDSSTVEPKWNVDADGVVWMLADRVAPDADQDERRLWSFDGREWTLRAKDIEWFTVDRNGTVWTSVGTGTSFLDGDTWRRYPRVRDVYALDVADDGTVWALGQEHSIYVIDPDAPTVDAGTSHLPVASG